MGSSNSKKLSPEEMKYLTPTGLYPSCSWDLKTIRKLIMEKKLAPFYPGREEKDAPDLDECPICFMFYGGGLNRTNCCHKDVCTECFLQIKKPGTPLLNSICPFCNRARFTVVFLGPKTREERLKEEMEEQKVIELQERMRQEEIERDIERQRQRQMEKDKRKEDDNEGEERIWSIAQNEGPPSSSKHDARSSTASAQDLAAPPFLPPSPTDASPEQDLEDLMVMEAIRLSLIDNDVRVNERSSSPSPEESDDDQFANYWWGEDDAEVDFTDRQLFLNPISNKNRRRGSLLSSLGEAKEPQM